MLRPRIIPCLLISDEELIKTFKFDNPKYVGDPINAVKIFNEKEVDEIIIIDINASQKKLNYDLIESLALECRMPFCYAGGIKTVEQALIISSFGVEKIGISSEAIKNPKIISDISKSIGSQSVVVILDVKKNIFGTYNVWINNGKINTGKDPLIFSKKAEDYGAGEIVINSIDNDGVMKGYDFKLINKIRDKINIPMTALGGAGSKDDLKSLFKQFGVIGGAAGSLFVFKGKYKAVLINYPDKNEKKFIFS